MTTPDLRTVQQIFDQVIDLALDERQVVLERLCGQDNDLRREVEKYLAIPDDPLREIAVTQPVRPGQPLLAEGGENPVEIRRPIAQCSSHQAGFAQVEADAACAAPIRRVLKDAVRGVAETEACPPHLRSPDHSREIIKASDEQQFWGHVRDYEPIRVCGRGAFGLVWIVKNRAGVYQAMKIIHQHDLAAWGIPNREITALGEYCRKVPDHPNLVKIYHIGQQAGRFYYTMELADDHITKKQIRQALPESYEPMTLDAILSKGRLKTDTAVEIALRLLKGLECLHLAGLVHRDIKPGNVIFVNRDVKLADVTLVSLVHSQLSRAGTPAYMPPDERMDETADTFAIGKLMHEMISGRDLRRFPNLPDDPEIQSSILDIGRIDATLCRACAGNGDDRFGSALEMRVALQSCRLPSLKSPLVELADRQIRADLDDSALAMIMPAHAVPRDCDDTLFPGGAVPEYVISAATPPARPETTVWAVLDLLVKLAPWIVVLTLGLYLIHRLTS